MQVVVFSSLATFVFDIMISPITMFSIGKLVARISLERSVAVPWGEISQIPVGYNIGISIAY